MNTAAEAPRPREAAYNPIIYDFVTKTHSCHLRSCRNSGRKTKKKTQTFEKLFEEKDKEKVDVWDTVVGGDGD